MIDDKSAVKSHEKIDLQSVWKLLSLDEQLEFWKYAGQFARNLNHSTPTFKKLCSALREADSGKSRGRPAIAIPSAVRALSSDELRLGIGRLKGRLLDQPNAQLFLVGAFCNWIQDWRREALNAVLDSVKCPRDARGAVKGDVPSFAPDDALRDICALAPVYTPHTLAMVCGALMLNRDDLWSGLSETFITLPTLVVSSTSLVPTAQPMRTEVRDQGETGSAQAQIVRTITIDDLKAIRNGLDLLGQHLTKATAEISAAVVPNLYEAIECWSTICKQHDEAERALGLSTPRIGDLEDALSRESVLATVLSDLARCHSIVHATDSNFAGCAVIRAKCHELKVITEARQELKPNSIRAVSALLQLVESGDNFDDDQATHLQLEVEELFGKTVATAALRGKLRIDALSPNYEIIDEPFVPAGAKSSYMNGTLESTALLQLPASDQEASTTTDALPLTSARATGEPQPSVEANAQLPTVPSHAPPKISVVSEPSSPAVSGAGAVEAKEAHVDVEIAPMAEPKIAPPPMTDVIKSATSYESFASFSSTNWVDASGSVVLAPWKAKMFAPELAKKALAAWELGQSAIAYLFARGVVAAGGTDPLGIDDLASADGLLSNPASQSAGVDGRRVERLRVCIVNPGACESSNIGLVLMLEALRPTHPCSFTPEEIEALIDRAEYNDPALSEVVGFLLQGWSAHLNPLTSLRPLLLNAPEESQKAVEAALHLAQEQLRTQVATLWSAAGGKIQRTHCRAAWATFIQSEVVPLRDELAPVEPKLSSRIKWTPERIRERVISFGRAFQRIMDAEDVRHQDRTSAENAAQQIVEAVEVVSDALQRLDALRQRSHTHHEGLPNEAGRRLLSGSSSNTADRLSAALFAAVLRNASQANMLRLSAGHLINHVDAIRYLAPNALSRAGIAVDGLSVLDFENPTAASSLLFDWQRDDVQELTADSELWTSLRNVAADRERLDILASLSSTDVLQSHERTLLHRYALELGDQAFQASRDLEQLWGASNELMAPTEAKLKSVVEESKSVLTVASSSMTLNLLFLAWLKQSVALAAVDRDVAAKALLEAAREKQGDVATQVANYFASGDFRSGVALFHGGAVPRSEGDRLGTRRTLWRADALKTWPEPRSKLANDFKGSSTEQNRLVELWTSGSLESNQRDSTPRLLYAVISGEAGRTPSENQKRFPLKLSALRDHKDRKTAISCEAVRNYFKGSKLNPSFLPQLAVFGQIVIAPCPMHANRGSSVLDDWCKVVSNEAPSSLVVFLAPGLPNARRDELCSGFRKRGVTAAIIDDLDLCRLCAATSRLDGHDFIPFLEILLEQLDLDTASPFSSLDGQHVRLETYIGRKYEAERVALGWSYSRVFSGRKLGKSALLKYVASTFDEYPLPSGNTLNVFFITIAGGESERWVVDCIVDEMAKRFSLTETPEFKDQPPAVRFSAYMKRFLQEKPRHSVLLILDEADAFVEGQLSRYDDDREGSLSFRMMKELPAQVDGNQLPRIRTIFSGYRVTNTRGGVWANAGDILVLRPLAEDEAVQFLEGMLARIGVVLGNHAPFVAMRCGFQPAVLIRFGESLVRRLKRANKSADRETLTVSHEEVLATLGEQGVLDEIKTVVNNNFQGNRIGAVIFGATLLALKDLEPGLALTEGPMQVLAKLREIDPNCDWLERVDTSPVSEIERNLQDFIDRELLTVSDAPRFGVREYRLRFPHFLPVLTQQSEVALEVRQQIQAIRGGASLRRISQCVLSESALDTIRYWYSQHNSNECKLIVVGGHWTDSLLDPKCGIPDRLGCERSDVSLPTQSDEAEAQIRVGKKVFGDVAVNLWESFLEADAGRPLVLIGGLDLQRMAKRYALDGGQVPVEVLTLGRLTEGTLTWWLEDTRALHFKAGNSIAKIAKVTGLVPFLVGAFDKLLRQTPGSEVSDYELEAALGIFEASMHDYAAQLRDTSWRGSLSLREIELLQMAVQVTEEVSEDFDLERDFKDYWSLLEAPSLGNAPFSNPGDWSSLKLLSEVGLLPTHEDVGAVSKAQSLGRVSFNRSGALVRLIKLLGQNSAT